MFIISDNHIKIGIESTGNYEEKLINSLLSSFPRRYLPEYSIIKNLDNIDVLIKWFITNSDFELTSFHQNIDNDTYVIKAPVPEPYINESPVFFLLQVFARTYVRKNYFIFTDSIAIHMDRKTTLLLGYPHSGKSTLTALSLNKGDIPLSTENTVVEITDNGLRVINGTSILIYDPRIEEIYGIKIGYENTTKHGYRVADLNKLTPARREIIKNKPIIDEIYILHCSFNAGEPGLEKVVGRKIKKTLWYFISSLLLGVDYYEPHPFNLLDQSILKKLVNTLDKVSEIYSNRVFEIYGSHREVYEYLKKL